MPKGYRVKSQRGTQFRIWANNILKQYLTQGYALNEKKLQTQQEKMADLKQAIALSSRLLHNKDLSRSESQGILAILEKYSHALTVLDDYDHQRLQIEGTQVLDLPKITYEEAIGQIQLWRDKENLGGLFGNEKDDSFKGSSNLWRCIALPQHRRESRQSAVFHREKSLVHRWQQTDCRCYFCLVFRASSLLV